ncbi:hypothetical protein ColLi_13079 [Colletotrichum liriopes]|uniref:Uncharacterized protein n=1 Tax=Colletotrichum liriopes TaxID=708192 RepID=A0AA37GZJ0_9PEZI|nr:hypothetical protein ColLi_13079 [Colletotrichum liriopes]
MPPSSPGATSLLKLGSFVGTRLFDGIQASNKLYNSAKQKLSNRHRSLTKSVDASLRASESIGDDPKVLKPLYKDLAALQTLQLSKAPETDKLVATNKHIVKISQVLATSNVGPGDSRRNEIIELNRQMADMHVLVAEKIEAQRDAVQKAKELNTKMVSVSQKRSQSVGPGGLMRCSSNEMLLPLLLCGWAFISGLRVSRHLFPQT